jgi:excisionase family DNA binding protein
MVKLAVTIKEASILTGIGRSSLYKLFNEGKLTPRKAGKRTLILVAELENFLRSLPLGANARLARRPSSSDTGMAA